jgi:hypothetical protein
MAPTPQRPQKTESRPWHPKSAAGARSASSSSVAEFYREGVDSHGCPTNHAQCKDCACSAAGYAFDKEAPVLGGRARKPYRLSLPAAELTVSLDRQRTAGHVRCQPIVLYHQRRSSPHSLGAHKFTHEHDTIGRRFDLGPRTHGRVSSVAARACAAEQAFGVPRCRRSRTMSFHMRSLLNEHAGEQGAVLCWGTPAC